MISFRQLREGNVHQKIVAVKKFSVLRDGGSHMHEVLNGEQCGYCQIIQDFSIPSKKNGNAGRWKGMPHPPNHTNYQEIYEEDIEFV
jgi:hypothetical protein